ncbi:MAG: winged helix-turn-helix transcriptional regulator [Magnetococcales bacterium]|nr:winged helix-turn-helix transcriptional regulator [Magnetococcales bacterium]
MHPELKGQVRDQVLMTLRQIIRAIDMHSRYLVAHHGLTGPQAILLSEILHNGPITGVELGQRVHLSKSTISGILARLEAKALIDRRRSQSDRRRYWLSASDKARKLLEDAPPLLQRAFVSKFENLPDYEQTGILTALLRVADMMGADDMDASSLLASTPLLMEESKSEAIDGLRMEEQEAPENHTEWELPRLEAE